TLNLANNAINLQAKTFEYLSDNIHKNSNSNLGDAGKDFICSRAKDFSDDVKWDSEILDGKSAKVDLDNCSNLTDNKS
ncbi:hypothetical protein HK100_010184, partial [Physocladia obscura]